MIRTNLITAKNAVDEKFIAWLEKVKTDNVTYTVSKEDRYADYRLSQNWGGCENEIDIFEKVTESGLTLHKDLISKFNGLHYGDEKAIIMPSESEDWMPAFIKYARDRGATSSRIKILVGEGDSLLLKYSRNCIGNSAQAIEYFDVIAGALMLLSDDEELSCNDFFDDLYKRKEKSEQKYDFKIRVGGLPVMRKSFLGYFHMAILGDFIYFEDFHSYNPESIGKCVIKDAELAKQAELYAELYAEYFTTNMKSLDDISKNVRSFEKEEFYNMYNDASIERLRVNYGSM